MRDSITSQDHRIISLKRGCGHATLASAHVVFRFLDPGLNTVRFQTRSGELKVERGDGDLICTALSSEAVGHNESEDGTRVILQGPCALYLTGEIEI